MKKKITYGISAGLILLVVILFFGSRYMLRYSLQPENRGKDIESSYKFIYENYPYLKPWVDSLNQVSALKDTFI